MIFISHRGNLDGLNPDRENSPDYIDEAIKLGFDVEVDVRTKDGQLWLGHDEPQYKDVVIGETVKTLVTRKGL